MEQHRLCYISRNYYNLSTAGNKAKTDYESILDSMGATNIGLPRKISSNKLIAFFYNLLSILKACFQMRRNDIVVLQYPVKKYFSFICDVARLKKAKTISLIHDLGSFRRKKLTIPQELKRLDHTDYVIATNESMKQWLILQGFHKPMGTLGFHDYLSSVPISSDTKNHRQEKDAWNIIYAGSLNLRKNAFILNMKEIDKSFKFHLYGNMPDYNAIAEDKNMIWHGFMQADDFIAKAKGDFGLVWDGDSLDECHGDFGGYLKYNTPHKASFYLRAGLPIIVWRQSAIAQLVEQEQAGIAIDSLKQLPQLLKELSSQRYEELKANALRLSLEINKGMNLKKAITDARL